MAIHRLDLDEFDEIDYYLMAIHTSLEDYRLAYFINKNLPINLSKSKNEIHAQTKEGEANFSRFYYYDAEKAVSWNLIQNKNEIISASKNDSQDLFSNETSEVSTTIHLLPEFKKVDFFLKIDNSEEALDFSAIQQKLNTIESIAAIYALDTDKIKSKNNLIF
ncbi:IPExxxVDY family protein [Flavobacterium sp. ANB]|uniref:IPExxxVDY family protein n=1 Tax=unclassified Flavobacterium TaxID=196869 RepID=UPI0012B96D73|nr:MULTISPECIES: IPExxxVDY family protein [unclassified Flavobacterium]MBF4515197.1 IPExxxVDY family protein [Flavobacterium sp. ANB]MTD70109.1 IPExxxVDY family protein [Flavobacterium sp. LC2016-13]